MNNKTKIILGVAIFAVFLGGSALAYNALSAKISPQNNIDIAQSKGEVQGSSGSSEAEKTKAPDFTVLDSEGNEVKLSTLVGKPIVLNFWASWCPPCKAEMPEFNKVFEDVGTDVTFMMVDLVDGLRETIEKGQSHIADNSFTFPVYYDTKQDAANVYGVSSIPTTYFIDKDGYLVSVAKGAIDEKTLRKGISMITDTAASSETANVAE